MGVEGFISKHKGNLDEYTEAIRSIMQGVNYYGKDISGIIYNLYVAIMKKPST